MRYGVKKLWVLVPIIVLITIAGVFLTDIANEKVEAEKSIFSNGAGNVQELSFEIHDEEDYLKFAQSVNDGNQYEGCTVTLCSDLDFSNYENVDGIGIAERRTRNFMGTFEGNGHKISGVKMNLADGSAGLFINLRGVVKNLRVEDCEFSGQICGAIASETIGATILNCYVEAKCTGNVVGEIVGVLDGNISNCVSTDGNFVAVVTDGEISNCYSAGEANISLLNENLYHLSGQYEDLVFCIWEDISEGFLSANNANLVETITGKMSVRGEEFLIKAYYSAGMKKWCVTLPANYGAANINLEVKTNNGFIQNIIRENSEEEIYFTWNQKEYPVVFLCADDIDTIYITLDEAKSLENIHASKEERATGWMNIFDAQGNHSYVPVKEFYGHGNGSWSADKKSYNLKLDSHIELLDMGANDDFVFLAGYRDDSLMSYVTTTELVHEIGFEYAPEFRIINLYVSGEYMGVYFLAEKVEIDTNRIDISNVYKESKELNASDLNLLRYCEWKDENTSAERYYYNVKKNPLDITGGYLLEADVEDYASDDSRFVSERGLQFTLKRAKYSSKEQMDYIADFWQNFENAMFSENGYNDLGKHYSEYIDMESFAMQWLIYELEEESSLNSSIYFYKESDVTGDGVLHACYPWDMEHSYVMDRDFNVLWMDWFDQFHGYWKGLYAHEDFKKEVYRVWEEKFVPAIDQMIDEESIEDNRGFKNLSWYQENRKEVFMLENSRWESVDPWTRCDEIRNFLTVRKEVLTRIFQ